MAVGFTVHVIAEARKTVFRRARVFQSRLGFVGSLVCRDLRQQISDCNPYGRKPDRLLAIGNPFPLPTRLSVRAIRQAYEHFKIAFTKCDPTYINRTEKRLRQWIAQPPESSSKSSDVFAAFTNSKRKHVSITCSCGALNIRCHDAPRITTVCHCSVCRGFQARVEAAENAQAPCFAAVRRGSCSLVSSSKDASSSGESPADFLEWQASSHIARRGFCKRCLEPVVMDYEWLEPNTVWLVNGCVVTVSGSEGVKLGSSVKDADESRSCTSGTTRVSVEDYYHQDHLGDGDQQSTKGRVDFDVCWESRHDPCSLEVSGAAQLEDMGGPAKSSDCVDMSSNSASDRKPADSFSPGATEGKYTDGSSDEIIRRGVEFINWECFELDVGARELSRP